MSATIPQLAFINQLYNDLDVPYSEREIPQTPGMASILINELSIQLKAMHEETEEAGY